MRGPRIHRLLPQRYHLHARRQGTRQDEGGDNHGARCDGLFNHQQGAQAKRQNARQRQLKKLDYGRKTAGDLAGGLLLVQHGQMPLLPALPNPLPHAHGFRRFGIADAGFHEGIGLHIIIGRLGQFFCGEKSLRQGASNHNEDSNCAKEGEERVHDVENNQKHRNPRRIERGSKPCRRNEGPDLFQIAERLRANPVAPA